MRQLVWILLFINYGSCADLENNEVNREKKDVSAINNLSSSAVGEKVRRYQNIDNNWNYKNFPVNFPLNRYPTGSEGSSGWGYQGNFGGSYVSTYERRPGGYTYDRPQGGAWLMRPAGVYPQDDTIIVYPTTNGISSIPTGSAGVSAPIIPAQNYPITSSLSGNYLPAITSTNSVAPIRPIISTVNVSPPAISGVPFQQPSTIYGASGPAITSNIPVTAPAIVQPIPAFNDNRPVISTIVGQQTYPTISTGSIAPILPPKTVFSTVPPQLVISPTEIYGSPETAVQYTPNSIDVRFNGYNYDRPGTPFL